MDDIAFIASLGRVRLIPSIFERAWRSANAYTVVRRSIEIDDFRQRLSRKKLVLAIMLGSLVGTYAFTVWVRGFDLSRLQLMSVPTIFAIFLYMTYTALTGGVVKFGMKDFSQIHEFREAWDKFIDWSGLKDSYSEKLLGMDEGQFKEAAKEILVDVALRKMWTESRSTSTREYREALSVEQGLLAEEFRQKYKVLSALGLVSGSYEPYYDEAERRHKEELLRQA